MSMNYLSEAFKELDLLEEGVEIQVNKGGVNELESFLKEDDLVADVETIIDPEAETEEELQPTYVGKVIVSCEVCNTLIYKNPEDIVIDEDLALVNVGELCPYCFNTDGYKVIGKVAPFEEVSVEAPEGVDVTVDGAEIESTVEQPVEQPVQQEVVQSEVLDKPLDESLEEDVVIPEADLILDSEELLLNDVDAGKIIVDKDVFDAFVQDSIIKIKFIDNNSNSIFEYKMISETPDGIEMEYLGEPVVEDTNGEVEEVKEGEVLNEDVDLLAKVDAFLDKLDKEEPVTEEVKSEEDVLTEEVDLLAKVDAYLASLEKEEPVKEELQDKEDKLEESFDNVNITTDKEVLKVESKDKDDQSQASGMENVEITTEDSVIKIKATPRADKEVVVPVTEEDIITATEEEPAQDVVEEPVSEEEVVEEPVAEEPVVEEPVVTEDEEDLNVDLPIDEFDEESFNDLAESYLKKVYDNVKSFKLTEGVITEDDNLLLEGVIEFESGKSAKTRFTFEALDCQDNKVRFIGLNENLARKRKAFTICGSVNDSKLICESLKYNYNVKQNGSSKRVYGTVSR